MHHQQNIIQDEIQTLATHTGEHTVSLYMPTQRKSKETRQNPIRYKNSLDQAEQLLRDAGASGSKVNTQLAEAKTLLDDTAFWQHQSDGLAVLINDEQTRCYRLPCEFENIVVLGNRFHFLPMINFLTGDGLFYVAIVSQDEVHVLECRRNSFFEVEYEQLPGGREIIDRFTDAEKQLQLHSTSAAGGAAAGSQDAIHHGQGEPDRNQKARIHEYFRVLDDPLDRIVRPNSPVVFAGVDYLFPIFHDAVRSVNVISEHVSGNFDEVRTHFADVHKKAWQVIEPYFNQSREESLQRYGQAAGAASDRTSQEIETVLAAAQQGQVDLLLHQPNAHHWGTFDEQSMTVSSHEQRESGDEDLINLAAIHAFLHGGTVYTLDEEHMPNGKDLAALLRAGAAG